MKIGSLGNYLQQLEKLGVAAHQHLFFRGHSKTIYPLLPSIFRNSGWIENEATMLKELILRCPNDFSDDLTTFECMVKMQHYGLPTRLLDVTSNPLVALYFACSSSDEGSEDGEVIVFNFDVDKVKYFDSDTVCVVANLSRRPSHFAMPSHQDIDKFNKTESIKLLLHDVGHDKPHFVPKIKPDDLERVVCVKPKLDNARIIRQEGAFLLFGCDGDKTKPAKLPGNSIAARFTINRDEKRKLRDQLEALGINRATMYPEIEQVASYLKQSYLVPSVTITQLQPLQSKLFGLLRNSGPATVHGLAVNAGTNAAAVSRAISELRDKGYVVTVGSGREVRWTLAGRLTILD
jgi:hypothetical protein